MTSYFQPKMSEADVLRALVADTTGTPINRAGENVGNFLSELFGNRELGEAALDPIGEGKGVLEDPNLAIREFLQGKERGYDFETGEWTEELPKGWLLDPGPAPVVEEEGYVAPIFDPAAPRVERPTETKLAPTAPGMVVSDVLEGRKEAYDSEIAKALKGQSTALDRRFGDVIERLRTDLHDYQLGKTGIDQAYNSYQKASSTIMRQAIIDAPDLAPTDVVEEVGRSYDRAEGALNDALVAIDTSGSPGMAGAMNAELRFWENSITKALTADVEMGDLLHESASNYAKAIAQAAYSNDQYQAESERTKIQIQLNGAIRDKREELARQNSQWKQAQQDAIEAQDEWGEGWSPEDYDAFKDNVFTEAGREYLMSMGLTAQQAREAMTWYQNARDGANDPSVDMGKISSNQEWMAWAQELVNDTALGRINVDGNTGSTAYDQAISLRWGAVEAIEYLDGVPTGERATAQRAEIEMLVAAKKNLNFADWDEPTIAVMALVNGWDPGSEAIFANPALNPFDENTASINDDFYAPITRLFEFETQFSETIDARFAAVRR